VASVVRFFGARNDEFADGVRRVRRDTPYRRKLVPRDSCPRGPGGDRTALSEGFRPRRHRRPTNSYLVGLHLCCGLLTCTDTALAAPSWPRFLGDSSGTAEVDPLTTPSLRTVRDALAHGIEWSLDKLSARSSARGTPELWPFGPHLRADDFLLGGVVSFPESDTIAVWVTGHTRPQRARRLADARAVRHRSPHAEDCAVSSSHLRRMQTQMATVRLCATPYTWNDGSAPTWLKSRGATGGSGPARIESSAARSRQSV
jgi:hypothetical protein